MNHVDETSQFLDNVEASARSILRKNNAIGRDEVRCEAKIPFPSKSRRIRDKLEASPLYNCNTSKKVSIRGESGSSQCNLLRMQPMKIKGSNRKSLVGKSSRSRPNDVILDVATLRNCFRCDEYLIFSSGGDGGHAKSRPSVGRKDHPIQFLISQHVATIAAKFDVMTQKRLSSMRAELTQSHLNELHQRRMQCWNNSVAKLDDEPVIKVEMCDDKDGAKTEIKVSLDSIPDGSQDSARRDLGVTLVKSKRLVPTVPPERWTIVARERIRNYSEAGDCRLFISRIGDKDAHCWIIELLDRHECKDRYILYDDEINYLVSSLPQFNADDFPVEDVNNACTLVHNEIMEIGDTGDVDGDTTRTSIDARIHIDQRGSILEAVLSVQIVGGVEGNRCPLAEVRIPIYGIIAAFELHHLFEALDTAFWTSKSNETFFIWKKLIRSIDITFDLEVRSPCFV